LLARKAKFFGVVVLFCICAGASGAWAAGIAFVGDSMSDGLWGAFVRMTAGKTCPTGFSLLREAQNGTGLARPDRLDWASHVLEISNEYAPDIFVMSIGLNDRQAIVATDGTHIPLGTQEWVDAYRERVRAFYQDATANGAEALIVGIPVLRDQRANDHAQLLNLIYEDVARRTPHVTYIPPWHLDGADGFVPYGPGPRGNVVQLRASDGVHFTTAGYDLLGIYLKPVLLNAMLSQGYAADTAPGCLDM
jgi:hypothetical protein